MSCTKISKIYNYDYFPNVHTSILELVKKAGESETEYRKRLVKHYLKY